MSSKDKNMARFLSIPKDFTYKEIGKLLKSLGYEEKSKGKTSGSRVAFYNLESGKIIILHKPHPGDILPQYAIKQTIESLKRNGEIT